MCVFFGGGFVCCCDVVEKEGGEGVEEWVGWMDGGVDFSRRGGFFFSATGGGWGLDAGGEGKKVVFVCVRSGFV